MGHKWLRVMLTCLGGNSGGANMVRVWFRAVCNLKCREWLAFQYGTQKKNCHQVAHLTWPLVLIGAYSHAGPVVMMLLWTVNFNHCGTLVSTWLDHSGEQAASVLLQAPYLVRKIRHLKTLRVYVCWFDPGSLVIALIVLQSGTSLWGRPRKLHRKPEKLRRSHISIFCH